MKIEGIPRTGDRIRLDVSEKQEIPQRHRKPRAEAIQKIKQNTAKYLLSPQLRQVNCSQQSKLGTLHENFQSVP